MFMEILNWFHKPYPRWLADIKHVAFLTLLMLVIFVAWVGMIAVLKTVGQ